MPYNKDYDQIPLPKLIKVHEEMIEDLEWELKAKKIPEKKRTADRMLTFYNSVLGRLKRLEEIETQLKLNKH